MAGTLYVVATPIGHRADLTPRAIETLRGVALIVAEDTRHSAPLLAWAGISTPVRSYHAHNEAEQSPRLVARLLEGSDVALISDAGTPLVSDPGARLVDAAIAAYEREGRRLLVIVKQVTLVDAALRGERHVPRL